MGGGGRKRFERPTWSRLGTTDGMPATGWLRAYSTVDRNAPTRYVGTGHGRGAMVVAHGGIWVANGRSKSLTRVGAETLEVTAVQKFRKRPVAVAAGPDAVWAVGSAGWVWRLWPEDERAEGVARLGRGAVAIATGGGLTWVLHDSGRLTGIEPDSGETAAESRLPGPARCMIGDGGGLWVAYRRGRRLARVDPRSGAIETEVELPQRAGCLAVADDHVLAGCPRAWRRGRLLVVDRSEGRLVAGSALPGQPLVIAVQDAGTAWVACGHRLAREGVIAQVALPSGAASEWWPTEWTVSALALSGGNLLAAMSLGPIPATGEGSFGTAG